MNSSQSKQSFFKTLFTVFPLLLAILAIGMSMYGFRFEQEKGLAGTSFHSVHHTRIPLPCGLPIWGDCFCIIGLPLQDVADLIALSFIWFGLKVILFGKEDETMLNAFGQFIVCITTWWFLATVLHMLIDPTPMDKCFFEPFYTKDQTKELLETLVIQRQDL
jgi:hypothetical protein